MSTLADRIRDLERRIADVAEGAGRDPGTVRVVAISKTVTADRVREAYAAGHRLFGENRAQELVSKTDALADLPIEWHFVGRLQTNKVRFVLPRCALIHSVDRGELAERISGRLAEGDEQPILVQVNTSEEDSKAGVTLAALPALLDRIAELPGLRVEGLMTIGPFTADRDRIRNAFRSLREARDAERDVGRPGAPLQDLSMGMTADFDIAIEEGATLVRVGTALFGSRE